MVLEYTLNKDHFLEFQLHNFHTSESGKKQRKAYTLSIIGIYLIIITILLVQFPGLGGITGSAAVGIIGAIRLSRAKKSFDQKIVSYVNAMVKDNKADSVLGDKRLTLEQNSLKYEELKSVSEIKTETLRKIEETEHCTLIYLDDISAIIVPKDCAGAAELTAALKKQFEA